MEEPDVDRLYALPLEQFTPSRDALAARLKMAGDVTESKRVKSLRKPTAPAWAVNQLARRYPKQVEVLIAASDRLRRAQLDLLQGAPAGDLWEATLAEREAVAELIKAVEWIMTEAGLGAGRGALDRIADTLYAASADPTGRSLLRRGLITQEMRRTGFGDVTGSPPPASPRAKAATPSKAKGKPAGGPTSKAVLEAERALQRATRDAERADAEAERLDRAARRAEDELAQAKRRAEGAARREASEARRVEDRADAKLSKLRKSRR